ncbi:MAG: hypothetical protein WD398_05270 [Cyclobacteriaceae bacterium]
MRKNLLPYHILLPFLFSILNWSYSQPCPKSGVFGPEQASNYIEITSENHTVKLFLEEVKVFPGGKERIYILLPDILTENNTPIIRWNELVLKKALNSKDNWRGDIDKVGFFPTSCFPDLNPSLFIGGEANDALRYEVNGEQVTLEGKIYFTSGNGTLMTLNLKVENQEIPKPLINDLDGAVYIEKTRPMQKLEIKSGELLYDPNLKTLRVSGTAEGGEINQVINFSITDFEGSEGLFPVNEGNANEDAFYLYQVKGNIAQGLEIRKYALPYASSPVMSYFETLPFNLENTDFDQMILLGEYHGKTVLVDPKPKPLTIGLYNHAFEGKSPTLDQLKKMNRNPSIEFFNWQNKYVIQYENLPIWGVNYSGNRANDSLYTLLVENITLSEEAQRQNGGQRLTYTQVDAINNGFLNIFEQFDQDSDTIQLKQDILELFKENNMEVNATLEDDFESFLVTTVSEFREAEKYALNEDSQQPANRINSSQLLPSKIHIHPHSGRPIERKFTYSDTDITIQYEDDIIRLEAENTTQGKQTKEIPSIPDVFDIQQFYAVLSHLPLQEDYQENLSFFDLRPVPKITYINGNRLERLYLESNFIHVEIKVKEKTAIDGQEIFQVEALFNGLKNPLFAESLEEDRTGEYFLGGSIPFKILHGTFDEGLSFQPYPSR